MDPLQLLTPAKPKAIKAKAVKPSMTTKQKVQPAKSNLKTPAAPVSIFAARQIEASHNKQAATILFTPYKNVMVEFALLMNNNPLQSINMLLRIYLHSRNLQMANQMLKRS